MSRYQYILVEVDYSGRVSPRAPYLAVGNQAPKNLASFFVRLAVIDFNFQAILVNLGYGFGATRLGPGTQCKEANEYNGNK